MIVRRVSGGKFDRTSHPKWKYRLSEHLVLWTSHRVEKPILIRSSSGYLIGKWQGNLLIIFSGYMYDGATGWPDHKEAMVGFAFHDFGYQLSQILTRLQWDQGMKSLHEQANYKLRHVVFAGVRLGGWKFFGKSEPVRIIEI